MKQLFLTCSLLFGSPLFADALHDILSDNQNQLFDYEYQLNDANSDKLEKSWINPIQLQYSKSYSKQFTSQTIDTANFSVVIDQPIFRSGGIYFAIKYANALRGATNMEIKRKKRELIGEAVKLLFEIKKVKLQMKKQSLLIQNDTIDIQRKQQNYHAGLIDSSFLDQAILKSSQDKTQLLELELSALKMRQRFALLSDKRPDTLTLPKFTLISKEDYIDKNIALQRDRLRVVQEKYYMKTTYAKYLPAVSLQGRYTAGDLNPLFARTGIEENYWTYGFTISMPLDFNMLSDIEASKVSHLKAQTALIESRKQRSEEYKLSRQNLHIIEQKIALAKRDEILYKRLYRQTKDLVQAGEKTTFDSKMMKHSLEVRKLDQQIYQLDKQIELLGLYVKVNSAI